MKSVSRQPHEAGHVLRALMPLARYREVGGEGGSALLSQGECQVCNEWIASSANTCRQTAGALQHA